MRWLYRIVFWGFVMLGYSCVFSDGAPVIILTSILLYYINRFGMRAILGQKRYFLYFLFYALLWILSVAVNQGFKAEDINIEPFKIPASAIIIFMPWLILTVSFQTTITKDWFEGFSIKDKFKFQIKRLRFEKTKTEMELLKTQLSPHLYKNLLTNIYELVLNNKSEAPDAIVHLKELMEYLLYDTAGKHKVELEKEIGFVLKLLEIRKLGLIDKNQISISIDIPQEFKTKPIMPFALLPFIENVFSHCNFNAPNSYAKLQLRINQEGRLIYFVENTTSVTTNKNNKGGLGIKNLRTRLEEYYKNKYTISLYGNNEIFKSTLEIKL